MLIIGSLGPGREMTAEEAVALTRKLSPQTPIIRRGPLNAVLLTTNDRLLI